MALASALFLLVGVFLVNTSEGAKESGWQVTALLGVMQAYEAALVGGAWLFLRKFRHIKSGLVLAGLELLLMPDVTFLTDNLPTLGAAAWPLAAIWAGFALAKFGFLAK
ncbi:MAG: hypothetical protein HY897_01685 [Deltaproteobacteria bacterium]|nr:hypothetical protein [Deltaproteobacteria bacterium]